MSDLIERQAVIDALNSEGYTKNMRVHKKILSIPAADAVPSQFIHEVIKYLTKCRDNAIHEETKTAWDEQRQTLIMLLHEWDAWNECGRTGKYGERRVADGSV